MQAMFALGHVIPPADTVFGVVSLVF